MIRTMQAPEWQGPTGAIGHKVDRLRGTVAAAADAFVRPELPYRPLRHL